MLLLTNKEFIVGKKTCLGGNSQIYILVHVDTVYYNFTRVAVVVLFIVLNRWGKGWGHGPPPVLPRGA